LGGLDGPNHVDWVEEIRPSAQMLCRDCRDAVPTRRRLSVRRLLGQHPPPTLAASAKAHCIPPDKGEDAAIRLAEKRVFHYRQLIDQIRGKK
jgi:hypothetical protein